VRRLTTLAVIIGVAVAACGDDDAGDPAPEAAPGQEAGGSSGTDPGGAGADTATRSSAPDPAGAVADRLADMGDAVERWRAADTLAEAGAAAETAANLVVGPNGPGYGDRDGDGTIGGIRDVGLLPGLDGTPSGLANELADVECVEADVLGGSWDDPAARWDEMLVAIDAWRPTNNTMPSLASHPMRVVGWATFTLGADSLDEAHEYGGHARLHVDVSTAALDC
jgi:hypothetical protein